MVSHGMNQIDSYTSLANDIPMKLLSPIEHESFSVLVLFTSPLPALAAGAMTKSSSNLLDPSIATEANAQSTTQAGRSGKAPLALAHKSGLHVKRTASWSPWP